MPVPPSDVPWNPLTVQSVMVNRLPRWAIATATLKRVLVTDNFAQLGGGVGIHDSLAQLTLIDTSVTGNDAGSGGGVFIDCGKLIVGSGSTVEASTPPQCIAINGGTGCPAQAPGPRLQRG